MSDKWVTDRCRTGKIELARQTTVTSDKIRLSREPRHVVCLATTEVAGFSFDAACDGYTGRKTYGEGVRSDQTEKLSRLRFARESQNGIRVCAFTAVHLAGLWITSSRSSTVVHPIPAITSGPVSLVTPRSRLTWIWVKSPVAYSFLALMAKTLHGQMSFSGLPERVKAKTLAQRAARTANRILGEKAGGQQGRLA